MPHVLEKFNATLRPLTESDVDQVQKIEADVYDDPWSHQLLKESIVAPMTHTLGVFGPSGCLAYAIFQVIFTEGHLLNIAVSKNSQNLGLGRFLLDEILKRIKSLGGLSVFLEVRPSNEAAKKLYERCNFRSLMTRENYYSNGEPALVMVLDFVKSKLRP